MTEIYQVSNYTPCQIGLVKGEKGDTGANGANGLNGKNGKDGKDGLRGLSGADGKSVYQIALDNGFIGTFDDYQETLKGDDNYQLAVKAGFDGDYDAWVALTTANIGDAAVNSILGGFVTIDSFELGATITQRNQALRHAVDGKLYRWAGDLPKVVPESSTPTSSGGMGDNAWLEVSDVTLRQDLANPVKGALLVRGAVIYVNTIADLQEMDTSGLVDGQVVSVQGSTLRWVSQEWVPDWPVSLRSFGAQGDGVTNDTQPFRNAVNYCIARSGHLYIPPGTYVLSSINYFQNIPDGTRLTISGAGTSSILKMADGAVTGRFHPLTLWSAAADASVWLTFKDFSVDNNARNSPLDPEQPGHQFEQSHTFQITGNKGIFEMVDFENIHVRDPVADVFNCGSRTCREFRVENCKVTERARFRSDIQFSTLPNKITVSDFIGSQIETEPVSSSMLDPNVTWNMTNIIVNRFDIGIGSNTAGGRVNINITNANVKEEFYVTGGRTVLNLTNSVINAGRLGGRNTLKLGLDLPDFSYSRITGCTILLPGDDQGGGYGFLADQSKIIFSDCEFTIDNDSQIEFDITGLSSPTGIFDSLREEWEIPKYILNNCKFDKRLKSSISAYRNGIWELRGVSLSGHEHAIYVGGTVSSTNGGSVSEVLIDSCDFRNVTGYAIRLISTIMPRSILTLTGDHLGRAACDMRVESGSRESINVVSSRRVLVDSTKKEIPILSQDYGFKGDTLVRKAAPLGEPISWYCVSYTANGWVCKEQAGIKNYAELPTALPTDAGWQILYNNVLATWDGINWRLPDGTAATPSDDDSGE